jgi:predicted O-methyltransferase YrrM
MTLDVLTADLADYVQSLLPERDEVLSRLEDEAAREGIPIVGPHEGALLSLLVRLHGGQRLLELRTATGYSGIWMLRGTDAGELVTFETNHERAQRARRNLDAAGYGGAQVIEADAVAGLTELQGRFDVCFNDLLNMFPSEDVTETAFHLSLDHLEPGGLLMADNALRDGEVARPRSQQARNVVHYNRLVAQHPRLESVIVPIRDGLSVAVLRH